MARQGNGTGEHLNGAGNHKKRSDDRQQLVEDADKQPSYNGKAASQPDSDGADQKEETPSVTLSQLFRFADNWDLLMLAAGLVCAILNGAYFPLTLVLFSNTIDKFAKFGEFLILLDKIPEFLQNISMTVHGARKDVDGFVSHCDELWEFYNHSEDLACSKHPHYDIYSEMEKNALYFVILAIIAGIGGCGQVYFFLVSADRQILRMRLAFYKNIIRQEMGWFDATSVGELSVKFTDDIGKIHEAIGDKLATSFQYIASSFTAVGLSFYFGWKFTLVMQCCSPLMFLAYSAMGTSVGAYSASERQAYAEAGSVAEEVFSSIRTVQAFGGQEKEADRYGGKLQAAHDFGVKKSLALGLGQGVAYSVMYIAWAIGYWYGGKLVRDGEYSITEMLSVFLSAMLFVQCLGMATPGLVNLGIGRAAAYSVYKFIDKPTLIDSLSEKGLQPTTLSGNIRLKGVHFTYPTRPDAKILKGLDLSVTAGQTVALVGPSGCGKSTIVQLLLRFYDPHSGQLSLDGVDIRDINIRWLRQSIGLVSQEPVLFATTIAENIRYGREGVSMSEIVQASKEANAYDFISKLPDGFDTHVGERGAQLSGGQKQRIAIARALVKQPKILLLDEATSALDTESETIVQDALDKARKGRTTLIIAHRLSTIRDADVIVVIDQGKVVEKGSHDQLMSLGGIYNNLVSSQLQGGSDVKPAESSLSPSKKSHQANAERRRSSGYGRTRRESSVHDDLDRPGMNTTGQALKRVLRLNKPEAHYVALGCLGALVNGALQTAAVMIIAQSVDAFATDNPSHEKHEMSRLSLISLGTAVVVAIAYTLQEYMFGLSGEALTKKIRGIMFKAMLRQDISWFDDPENETGKLTARLSLEASAVQGSLKTSLGYTTLALGNVISGFICAFVFGWRLAIVLFAFVPLQILSGLMSMKVYGGAATQAKTVMEDVSRDAMESVDSIRTVASLTKELTIYEQVEEKLWTPFKKSLGSSTFMCVMYGLTQAVHFMSFGLAFWYGARLLRDDHIKTTNVFRVLGPMIMGTQQLGRFVAFAPDVGKSLKAASRIFDLQDRRPPIDSYSKKGDKPAKDSFSTRIKFANTNFRYPTRPDVKILNGLELSVEPGQTLALVGESGCGKSTTIQLVERFYDPELGSVSLDRYNLKDLNIQWLRAQIGLVSQEPILFDQTIAENIAYGDNSRTVSMDEIIQAAKSANIHNFIQSLPMGYETNVGSKGTQLSGGQKQRVAIARALVRKPKILLLDEATSALDAESEKVVQEALDKARAGRTCITIAHRLTTIKDADKIAVFKNGVVHEIGTHDTLMAKKDLYFKLQQAQNK